MLWRLLQNSILYDPIRFAALSFVHVAYKESKLVVMGTVDREIFAC